MSMKDHLSAANRATPPGTEVPDGSDLSSEAQPRPVAENESLETIGDLIGRIVYFPGMQPFAGPKIDGRTRPVTYNNAAYLITGETDGQLYTGNFVNFNAINMADKSPLTLQQVMPKADNQPVLDDRIGSIQVRCGGNTTLNSVFFLSSAIDLDGQNSFAIPHQGLSMTRLTSYSQMHSLLAEREPREFIPFVGQQNMAANILCTHLKHGNALLCPADTPNLLTMDLNETERAIDDATRRFRHPVITDPSMVYHV